MSTLGMLEKAGVDKYASVRRTKRTLTSAQIKALRATPQTLVEAPGSSVLLEFLGAILYLDAGTNVLAESTDNLAVKYTDGSGVAASETIEMTNFLDQSADTLTNAVQKIDTIVAASGCLGKPLVLHNTGNGEFTGNAAGDAQLIIYTFYRRHKF
jgi:hypothetical protein